MKRFCVSLAVALSLAAIGALAQVPGPGLPPPPPTQGFESNIQVPATYTPHEAAAVAVVEGWVRNTAAHDLDGAMGLLDDNIVSRPDPARQAAYGPAAQCASYPFTRNATSFVRLDELYAVGGPLDTLVLFKRADINAPAAPAGGRAGFSGFTVQVAVFLRVFNGKITEWLDAPINRIGGLVGAAEGALTQPPAGANVPDACKKYPVAGRAPAQAPAQSTPAPQFATYGTAKPERYWNVEEMQAAQTVRAWFAARQSDVLLLGAFADQNVVFRTDAAAKFAKGRAALLRAVCGTVGRPQRLTKLYPIGADFDTLVLTESVDTQGARTASLFRVQKSLITEWMDVVVERTASAPANQNSAACEAVDAALPK